MEKYLEQTILSIISQDYPNLEYIIVDGGSTDHTMDIINKYKSKISIIISEPDNGMYDAINKGIESSTGDILAWLNADDIYFPWTLSMVAKVFSENNEISWIRGIPAFLDESGCNVKSKTGIEHQILDTQTPDLNSPYPFSAVAHPPFAPLLP